MTTQALYTYENCHKMHEQHPDTFAIPSGGEVAGLIPGDYVKLIFILPTAMEGHPQSERMWVKLESIVENGEFIGKLANTPVFLDKVSIGELVAPFRIEHIAALMYDRKDNPAPLYRTPLEVMALLVQVMSEDNGGEFSFTQEQYLRAEPHIIALQKCGHFADDAGSLESSFWEAAAGEYNESREYFAADPVAYERLSEVLNEIFES